MARIKGDLVQEEGVVLEDCVVVGPSFIGRRSYVGDFSHVAQQTQIGRYCSIGHNCTIGAQGHELGELSTHKFVYESRARKWESTWIGNDVWVGDNAVVLGGVVVGDGAVVGAGAVVTRDVEPYAVVVGVPARVLKYRFTPEVIAELLDLKWWDIEESKLLALPFSDVRECLRLLTKE